VIRGGSYVKNKHFIHTLLQWGRGTQTAYKSNSFSIVKYTRINYQWECHMYIQSSNLS
jgi:hypothetical protein